MFTGKGIINYDDEDGFRITLKINPDLSDYYRSLLPKALQVTKPGWPSHITVVRPEKEIPPKIRYWGDYQGEEVEFIYSSDLEYGHGFYWFNAWSKRLEDIREELGLDNYSRFPLIPFGYKKTFHCTIGKYSNVDDNRGLPEG
jgi:hypothetical protein